jgi:hypothetical protein
MEKPEHNHTSEGYETCDECLSKVEEHRKADNRHAISNMERALKTYKTRNRVYGNNYKRFGAIMAALYPNGVTIKTEHEWNRFGIILQKISKLSRYVTDPMNGHIDSIHDDGVYSFMLEELDSEQAGMDITSPIDLKTIVEATVTRGFRLASEEALKEIFPNPCEHVYNKKDTKGNYCGGCGEREEI